MLLRTGQKTYRSAIHSYLLDKVLARIEDTLDRGEDSVSAAFAASQNAVFSEQWVDIGGQLMDCIIGELEKRG